MSGKPKITNDHTTIRQWAEERDGQPASVKATSKTLDAGVLRINFPGFAEDGLKNITWKEFFKKFDDSNLYFVYQEETKSGDLSRFGKFIDRVDAERDMGNRGSSNPWLIAAAATAGIAAGAAVVYFTSKYLRD
jgi:hypothetical protein